MKSQLSYYYPDHINEEEPYNIENSNLKQSQKNGTDRTIKMNDNKRYSKQKYFDPEQIIETYYPSKYHQEKLRSCENRYSQERKQSLKEQQQLQDSRTKSLEQFEMDKVADGTQTQWKPFNSKDFLTPQQQSKINNNNNKKKQFKSYQDNIAREDEKINRQMYDNIDEYSRYRRYENYLNDEYLKDLESEKEKKSKKNAQIFSEMRYIPSTYSSTKHLLSGSPLNVEKQNQQQQQDPFQQLKQQSQKQKNSYPPTRNAEKQKELLSKQSQNFSYSPIELQNIIKKSEESPEQRKSKSDISSLQQPQLTHEQIQQLNYNAVKDHYLKDIHEQNRKMKLKRGLTKVLCLSKWKLITKNQRQQRQLTIKKAQTPDLLHKAVEYAMNFSAGCLKSALFLLFQEEEVLDYYMHTVIKSHNIKFQIMKQQKLINVIEQLLNSISKYTHSQLKHDNLMIQFLDLQVGRFQLLFDGLYPRFILERYSFSADTLELRDITPIQREALCLFFYLMYGIFNRLIDPWKQINISVNDIRKKNAQIVLSILFYLFHDYLKKYLPLAKASIYYPNERLNPLVAYAKVIEQDLGSSRVLPSQSQQLKSSDIETVKQELYSQALVNDNIIVGLIPRHLVENIISKEDKIISAANKAFSSISFHLVQMVDKSPPYIKDI